MHTGSALALCIALTSLLVACASERPHDSEHTDHAEKRGDPIAAPMNARMVGSIQADQFVPSTLTIDGSTGESNSVSSTDTNSMLITITGEGSNYSVLFGGCDADTVNKGVGKGHVVVHSPPAWHTEDGYALAWGYRPFVETERVVTGSDGTVLFVRVLKDPADSDRDVDQIVLVRGGPATVRVRVTGTLGRCNDDDELDSEVLLDDWTYVECTKNFPNPNDTTRYCFELSDVKRLAGKNSRDLRKFVMAALKARRAETLLLK